MRKREMIRPAMIAIIAAVAAVPLSAQEPTCHSCPATYIERAELDTYAKRAMDNGLTDQQVRSVDLGKTQLGLGIVYRGKLDQPPKDAVAEHDFISEVYHIIEGSATLVTGPNLVDAKQRPSTLQTVREYNGPGKSAASIANGVTYHLKPGDVIIIPAGTGHLFTHIDDHIVYLMVRIDPDKVVPLKNEAQSKAYLATPAKKGAEK
jgi:mannose-6-phosphate isomerase-like protein (cupin superfamily)